MEAKVPVRRCIAEVISGRYAPGERPISWDERAAGVECVRTTEGEVLLLRSNGQQSTPAPFWELLLTESTEIEAKDVPALPAGVSPKHIAYSWTLYGIGKGAPLGRYATLVQKGSVQNRNGL